MGLPAHTATADRPGADCLLAVDLMKLAGTFTTKRESADPKSVAHVLNCAHCGPRFNALTSFYQMQPVSSQPERNVAVATATLDSWAGQLTPSRVLAADMGQQVIAAKLLPGAGCKFADHALYAELHCESARGGKIRCQLRAPVEGKGATGTPRDVLDRFARQQYLVELSGDDPYGACGFDTILQWDDAGKCLLSPSRVLSVSGHSTFDKLELTHLREVQGYDME